MTDWLPRLHDKQSISGSAPQATHLRSRCSPQSWKREMIFLQAEIISLFQARGFAYRAKNAPPNSYKLEGTGNILAVPPWLSCAYLLNMRYQNHFMMVTESPDRIGVTQS